MLIGNALVSFMTDFLCIVRTLSFSHRTLSGAEGSMMISLLSVKDSTNSCKNYMVVELYGLVFGETLQPRRGYILIERYVHFWGVGADFCRVSIQCSIS